MNAQLVPIHQLPDGVLTRIFVAAAIKPEDPNYPGSGGTVLPVVSALSLVCKRWRGLCFGASQLWEMLRLEEAHGVVDAGQRQRWLQGKLWLLQRVGPLVAHLCLAARHNALSMTEPLMRAAPCTLPALSLSMCFGALFRDVPPLLALARVCFPSLASLELNTTAGHLLCDFARPDLEDMDEPAAQRETALMGSVVASVKALAGTLTELSLLMSPDIPVCLVPLAALRRLRRLRVAGMPFREASWGVGWSFTLPQPGTLTLRGGLVSQLPALLAALRPPAAQPLEKLFLSDQRADEGAAPAAAALRQLRQLAPHLEHVCELEACNSASSAVLEPLLLQLPRLKTLRLDGCRLSALPAEPYLSGLRTLSLAGNDLQQLPPAVLQAARLQQLVLQGNRRLSPSGAQLWQLLQALPELQLLNLAGTGIGEDAANMLKAAAAERGLTVGLRDATAAPGGVAPMAEDEPLSELESSGDDGDGSDEEG
ncbi:hypothetical protein COHA_003355 [Chlorella ohadii]|uniref:Uncharacterized protein n=1 Tax=Chlorella ohadii TaxID=2649997 RepID=A0AAD5DV23_9CHLO|nr:hypothetical protein COHA_003355 [Chlorella ohadii]